MRNPERQGEHWSGTILSADALPEDVLRFWAALCEKQPQYRSPFFSPAFTRAVASVREDVYVCLLKREGRLVGVLPFEFSTPRARLLRVAEPVGADFNDFFGVLLEPDLKLSHYDLLRLAGLNGLWAMNLHHQQTDLGIIGLDRYPGSAIAYGPDPAAYWARVRSENSHFTAQTERRERRLVKDHGPLRIRLHTDGLEMVLEHLIDIKRKQYRRTGVPDVMRPEWKRRLMHRLARENDCQCTGMLSTVHAGETWVASHLGLRNGPLLHYWFPVYNEDLSKYSPGHILIKQIIEQTPSDGIFEMDFGCGEGQHKKSYVRETYCVYRDYWKGPGLSGAICGMLGSLQNPGYIKRRIKTLTKKTVTDRLSKNGDKDPNGVNDE